MIQKAKKTANANKLHSIPLLINELDYLRGERLDFITNDLTISAHLTLNLTTISHLVTCTLKKKTKTLMK